MTAAKIRPEVAIVGAGIGGLAAAVALLRDDVSVTVFEQAPELGEVGAGVMLTPNASRCLEDFGILEEVTAEAVKPEITRVRNGLTGEILSEAPVGSGYLEQFQAPFLCVHRADIHSALLDCVKRLDPGCIRVSHRLADLRERADGVLLRFDNGAEYLAAAAIGCDGIRSVVREQLGIDDSARFTGNVAWRGLVPAEEPVHGRPGGHHDHLGLAHGAHHRVLHPRRSPQKLRRLGRAQRLGDRELAGGRPHCGGGG
jgi:salicylate hydroxylase